MSVSVFEHPFLSGLLGDEPLSALFSAAADIEAMVRFEAALAAYPGYRAAERAIERLRRAGEDRREELEERALR